VLQVPIAIKEGALYVGLEACIDGEAVGLLNPKVAVRGMDVGEFAHVGRREYTYVDISDEVDRVGCYIYVLLVEMNSGLSWERAKNIISSKHYTSESKAQLMCLLELLATAGIKCVEDSVDSETEPEGESVCSTPDLGKSQGGL
jgi:hypothetical protein